ncbi:Glyoxylase, beta-lactamase superfamily II [Chishuiella changwenlii]|uniref:Glyoxylase, beta-lactamase superfamily II n=1 Tax=Chishuiella changwenlii TaxID=1434701 RepID=A0A1M7BP80_9FLAO|nr:MBL fold metallo-hydrolase [Chishuiella changwenlii]GGF03006.1 MBL fold hydrolase [Chishuiella changwenlii]SHL56369.1 Glyoxylase, beta-lactamase superfamily II [Chishuiella changwenlii]
MPKIHTIDLNFQNGNESIATYLIETEQGPVLVDPGPYSTFENLKKGIENLGFNLIDVENILITHIHFDHAGAAWKFTEHGATIFVHPVGLPHLKNPEKLWESAKMIYGDSMDRLWGKMKPIDEEYLVPLGDGQTVEFGDTVFQTIYTPGHAVHHNAYVLDDVIFTGDVAGVKINNGPVAPPCPPPDINIELWKQSINKLRKVNAKGIYPTHYGLHENVEEHFTQLENELDDWANYMKPMYDDKLSPEEITPIFVDYIIKKYKDQGLSADEIQVYEYANPTWMSVNGLLRYWKLKEQGRI